MRAGLVVVVVVVVVAGGAAVARAEMPARVSVAGEGACPTAAAVARALERLHPSLHTDGGVRVEVLDRGARYQVRAAERLRTLEDPARRCGERATAAALAATLLLDPPSPPPPEEPSGPLAPRETPPAPRVPPAPRQPDATSEPRQPAPEPPATTAPGPTVTPPATAATPTPPPPAPAPTVRPPPAALSTTPAPSSPELRRAAPPSASSPRPSRIDLELVGLVDGAPALQTSASEVTGGGSLRLVVGGRYVAGTLGFTGLAPATATSAGIDVHVLRLTFDPGLRLLLPLRRVEPGVDVGLALAILQLSAPTLAAATPGTRLDVGLRIAPLLRILLTSRLALVLGMQIVVSFAPYDLVVNGAGTIATTPRLWLGGGAGLAARF